MTASESESKWDNVEISVHVGHIIITLIDNYSSSDCFPSPPPVHLFSVSPPSPSLLNRHSPSPSPSISPPHPPLFTLPLSLSLTSPLLSYIYLPLPLPLLAVTLSCFLQPLPPYPNPPTSTLHSNLTSPPHISRPFPPTISLSTSA